jgi:hypothetical protein
MPLNSRWDFAIDAEGRWSSPRDVLWDRFIQLPFAPEAPASGVGEPGLYRACWYRRTLPASDLPNKHRLLLHFGAVDYRATVWVEGMLALQHDGGYSPFTLDLTPFVQPGRSTEIVVLAEDDPADLAKPRGKQDWQRVPHSAWYPRTTGIWQTVWLERVPSTYIGEVRWTPNVGRWEIGFDARIAGQRREGMRLAVKLRADNQLLVEDNYTVVAGEVHRRISLSDPGVDDYRNRLLWSPASPTLIDVEIELWADRGELLDVARSYTALRGFEVQDDRILLNGRPFLLKMVLDQGYWPQTGLTAPDDAALRRDVELARDMGFNGVRKHQKIEDPRYLFWADVLGLLVWEEMPSAYRFTHESVERTLREWTAVIDRDYSHPSVMAWVPFNESWGVPAAPATPSERHYVEALYHLTRTLDPTRPVVGDDGCERTATDIIGVHDYDADLERLARRYHSEERRPEIFRRERPAGRLFARAGQPSQPIVLSACGGIGLSSEKGSWGYCMARDSEDLANRYRSLLSTLLALPLFAGFCYTQFTDTYQEATGLLHADRTPKVPLAEIAAATRFGGLPPSEAVPEKAPIEEPAQR